MALVKESIHTYYILINLHHIIFDAKSFELLIKEFLSLYNGEKLHSSKIQFGDYVIWQKKLFKTEYLKKQRNYWLKIFNDKLPILNMPTDYPRLPIQNFEGEIITFEIQNGYTNIKNTIINTKTTMHIFLLTAFYILLFKYTGQDDIIIGIPTSGRNHYDSNNILGMFVNTVAIRSILFLPNY